MVQIQFNYLDYDNPAVQSRRCYEVCRKHIVMEPVGAVKIYAQNCLQAPAE